MANVRIAGTRATGGDASRANLAVALAAVAVAVWVVLMAADADGPIWLVVGVLSAAAAVTGWQAGGGARPVGRTLAAVVVGGLLFIMFVVFTIAELA